MTVSDITTAPIPPLIVEREDGLFQVGWHDDAPGPFETMQFAQAVAAERAQQQTHTPRTGPGSTTSKPRQPAS
jgi:hypothetical protein